MYQAQATQLGQMIAAARHRKGLSLRDLEQQVRVSRAWLGHLERGVSLSVPPDRLARLADVLELEPTELDRFTVDTMADSLPPLGTYFRAKYDMTPSEIDRLERYVRRLRGPS
jgi:transcriptional regulator with XRE-family HTH domain